MSNKPQIILVCAHRLEYVRTLKNYEHRKKKGVVIATPYNYPTLRGLDIGVVVWTRPPWQFPRDFRDVIGNFVFRDPSIVEIRS